MTGVVSFALGPTPTYSERRAVWVPGGSTAWAGVVAVTTVGRRTETKAYAVSAEGGRFLLQGLDESGAAPATVGGRNRRLYYVRPHGHKLTCTCRATEECKHTAVVSRLLDLGILECRTVTAVAD